MIGPGQSGAKAEVAPLIIREEFKQELRAFREELKQELRALADFYSRLQQDDEALEMPDLLHWVSLEATPEDNEEIDEDIRRL